MKEPTIKGFIGKAEYDPGGQMIFGRSPNDNFQLIGNILSVRGWGAIQHLFKTQEEAGKFQDEMGQFIADAINEKIERLQNT